MKEFEDENINMTQTLKFVVRMKKTWEEMLVIPFPNDKFLTLPKLKEFADDNFKFVENWKKVLITGRKHCGKGRYCSL